MERPDRLRRHGNIYVVLFAIIFAETGLVVTPFLPGDSLLFAVGAIGARREIGINLPLVTVLLIVAAILGDAVNYWIGYKLGPAVFKREDSKLLNKKHLLKAQEFYEKYGGKTIILARFVPIVRTFAPFVAGVGQDELLPLLDLQHRRRHRLGADLRRWRAYFFGQFEFVQEALRAGDRRDHRDLGAADGVRVLEGASERASAVRRDRSDGLVGSTTHRE